MKISEARKQAEKFGIPKTITLFNGVWKIKIKEMENAGYCDMDNKIICIHPNNFRDKDEVIDTLAHEVGHFFGYFLGIDSSSETFAVMFAQIFNCVRAQVDLS